MQRLTRHRKIRFIGFSQRNAGEKYIADIYEKLMKLEDIEEKFGIDLITLLKALTNGYWHYDGNKYVHYDGYIALYNNGGEYYIGTCLLSNYGKTWALTREELL